MTDNTLKAANRIVVMIAIAASTVALAIATVFGIGFGESPWATIGVIVALPLVCGVFIVTYGIEDAPVGPRMRGGR